jgi:RND superfamily putative drug exporter
MISSVTTAVVRRHRLVLALTTVALIVAGVVGGGVFAKLSSGGFEDPASASARGYAALDKTFHTAAPNVVLLVTASAGVDDPANRARGLALTDRLAGTAGTRQVSSYWSTGGAVPLRSRDGTSALVLGRQDSADAAAIDRIDALARTSSAAGFDVRVGGGNAVGDAIGTTIQADLAKAEAVAVPVSLVLLVFVFGSLVAASLPLAIGAVAVVGTLLALRLLAAVTDVSVYSVNLTTGLGLGLAVDYSLFVVTRYREELRRGLATEAAIVAAARTAGRTVLFSGLTVALSLAALLVFPLYFLRSFAYAGIAVVLLAMVGALVVLPALLAALGPRIDAVDVGAWVRRRLGRPPRRAPGEGTGLWHWLAMLVMRRPVVLGTAVVVLLLGLGLPFLGVHFGLPDDRVLAPGASGRQVADVLRSDFASQENAALSVVAPGAGDPASPAVAASTAAYAGKLSRLPGVVRVDAVTGSYAGGGQVAPAVPAADRFASPTGTWLSVVSAAEAYSAAGERLARDVRAAPAPYPVLVTGDSAQLVDTEAAVVAKLPLAAGIIGGATLVLLFLFTGSVVLPVKAIVLNLLSLTATFGAMVWGFQEGHLRGLLGDFTVTHTLDTTTPILMFCVAFGLSMDYEVFLLSRIKEEYVVTGDNRLAVAHGLERTGRLVSAAAALIAIIFLAFATSSVTFIKLMGVGLALAVLVDATLVRGVLVPAFMRLAGGANWWAPAPLRRLHARIGLTEEPGPAAGPATGPADGPAAGPAAGPVAGPAGADQAQLRASP